MHSTAHDPSSSRPATRASDALDADLDAFNAAFEDLDLDWRWDRAVLEEAGPTGDDRARVAAVLERRYPHLRKVYDTGFLVELIVAAKARRGISAQ
jgi:hypothetical protein